MSRDVVNTIAKIHVIVMLKYTLEVRGCNVKVQQRILQDNRAQQNMIYLYSKIYTLLLLLCLIIIN